VTGGAITCGRWGAGDQLIVAAHGITANHLSWQRVGQLIDERSGGAVSLVAVDHRGRAGSADTPGPYGLAAHADDLMAVLDHFELGSATLTGHSMGAFVIAAAAERHPDRVDRLVLVDGGLPLPVELPPDSDVEAVVQSVIGPALDRLDQHWPDEDAYVEFFRAHPAFQPPNTWTETVEAYVRYDAVTTAEGEIRSSAVKEAVLVDGGAAIVDPESAAAIERVVTPSQLLWAPRGILDQSPGLYPPALIDDAVERLAHLDAQLIDDTNHYTIMVADAGAGAIADALLS
jgi:pimeloyl-ACP methyl ester carboxylesterase